MTACVGIDVSAKTLDAGFLRDPEQSAKSTPIRGFENRPESHRELIKAIRASGATKVVCEATGVYHLDLAFALVEAGIPLMVCNPRQVKHFIQARLRNTQTDSIDAYELAQFGARMKFVPWRAPSAAAYALHRIARALHGYVEQATAIKNRLHAAQAVRQTPKVLLKTLRDELAFNEKLQKRLTKEALALIAVDAQLNQRMQLLISVPGIAQTSAVQILGELCVLADDLSAKAWVKLAGLDPSGKQSGTSVKTKPCISRRGNAKLRGALFMPAMGARRWDKPLSAWADRLIAAGKTKLQAIVAIQRKLLHGIHAMFATHMPWDSSKLVRLPASS
jgi:transposase